jgi:hypothetical protein
VDELDYRYSMGPAAIKGRETAEDEAYWDLKDMVKKSQVKVEKDPLRKQKKIPKMGKFDI